MQDGRLDTLARVCHNKLMITKRRQVLNEIAAAEELLAKLKGQVTATHADPKPEVIEVAKGVRRLLIVITAE